jgi:hypothetical protein
MVDRISISVRAEHAGHRAYFENIEAYGRLST